MGRKKFLFVSAAKKDLPLIEKEHRIIGNLFPSNHKYIHSLREKAVSFNELFSLFEANKSADGNLDTEILHFAGHSGPDGLLFDADKNASGLISKYKFKEFISWYPNLKVIILNSCASNFVTEKLKEIEHLDVIIETNATIYDRDAILFTKYFYGFLNDGHEISEAFDKVRFMFENGNINITDRGNKREIKNRIVENENFPWKKFNPEGREWRLFKKIPDSPTDNVRILHWYEGDEFRDILSASLENVYLSKTPKTEVYKSELFKSKEDYERLNNFDSVLIFLTEDFQKKWEELGIESAELIKNYCKVGVVNCSGSTKDIKTLESHGFQIDRETIMPIGPISFKGFKEQNNMEPLKVISSFCDEGIKYINSKKDSLSLNIVRNELDNQFTSLNFIGQKILTSEFKKINLFVIEGTNECGHELCIRRILNTAGSNPLPINTHPITIKKMDDFNSSIDGFWKMLYDEIMDDGLIGDIDDCVMALLRKAQLGDVILTIEHLNFEQELFPIINEFWIQFIQNKKVVNNTTKNNVFIFFLNKSYCKTTCCWTETIPKLSEKVLNKKFDPITFLEYSTLEDWYSNNLNGIKEFDVYKKLKSNLNNKIEDNSPIGSVVKKICTELGVEGFEKTIMSVNNRYER